MWRYIFWKSLTTLISIFAIAFIVFVLMVSVKGNPYISRAATMKPEDYQHLLETSGILDSPIKRFGDWFIGIFHGNFGQIYDTTISRLDVPSTIFKPLSISSLIFVPAFFIGMIIGLILGFVAGYNNGKWQDIFINGFVTLFIAIPSFVLAAFALIIGPAIGLPTIFQDTSPLIKFLSIIMPILVMTLVSLASWTYLTRIEVSKVLSSDYIIAVRAKGISEIAIFWKYVIKNVIYPYIGAIVTSFMAIFGSSIIIEKFFNVPGTASIMLTATKSGEINLLMFNLIFFSFIGLFSQLFVDIAIFTINPVIKFNFSSKSSPIFKLKQKIMRWYKFKHNNKLLLNQKIKEEK